MSEKPSRLVRRYRDEAGVENAPKKLAIAMDLKPDTDISLLMGYFSLVGACIGKALSQHQQDVLMVKLGNVDLSKKQWMALLGAAWLDSAYKQSPGTFCGYDVVPDCDFLIDETILDTGPDTYTLKAVAYRLGTELEKSEGLEFRRVPTDEIDMLTSMAGSMTVTVSPNDINVDRQGVFAEDEGMDKVIRQLRSVLDALKDLDEK